MLKNVNQNMLKNKLSNGLNATLMHFYYLHNPRPFRCTPP